MTLTTDEDERHEQYGTCKLVPRLQRNAGDSYTVWWGEATEEPARADARPTENANRTTTRLT